MELPDDTFLQQCRQRFDNAKEMEAATVPETMSELEKLMSETHVELLRRSKARCAGSATLTIPPPPMPPARPRIS